MKHFILLFLLLCANTATASTSVHEYHLDNGLKLVVKEDHRAPVLVSQVWYKVGSSYEHGGITGISHALEHMMFRGTPKHPDGEFSKIISEQGGQENAFTSQDYTAYYQVLSADKLPVSFQMEADRMRNLVLKKQSFLKEIQVVMEERRWRTDNNPQQLTYERFISAAYVSSPYHNPTIGWMNDLKIMTASDLRTWYHQWYAPNNAILVVVGDVQPQKVFTLAKKYFGPLKPSKLPALKSQLELKPLGLRTVVVHAPAKLPSLLMGYNAPSINTAKTPWEPYALEVLTYILDGGNSARFSKHLVRGKAIATTAGAGYNLYKRGSSLLTLSGIPAQKHSIAELKKALLNEVEQLKKQQVSTAELDRIKTQVMAHKVYQRDSIRSQATEIGSLEAIGLSWKEADDYVAHIQAVTPAQIQAVAKKYLTENRLTIATLQPLEITPHVNKK